MRGVPRPLTLFACLLFLAPVIAGCVTGDPDEEEEDAPRFVSPASVDHPFSLFLCTDGYRTPEDIANGTFDRCNHRVTKPLLDPNSTDVRGQHGPANEVSIAVHPMDPLVAAGGGKDYTVSYVSDHAGCGEYTVWMGTYWTTDGGLTWGNDLMPGYPGDPRDSPLKGNDCHTDPVLVFDDDGTLWYSGLNYRGGREDTQTVTHPATGHDVYSGSQLYFAKSTDGGATYPEVSFAAFGDNEVVFNDKQWYALQPAGDHMIATWSQFWTVAPPVTGYIAGNDLIVFVESMDGGVTWSQEKPLRPGGDEGGVGVPAAGQFSMPQYLPASQENDIAVIWWDFSDGKVLYSEGILTPGGTEFLPIQSTFPVNNLKSEPGRDGTGPSTFRLSTYPVLALDTSGGACDGRRYVVWADQPGEVNSDTQVLLRWSDDGLDWSPPITVNDVESGDQFMPWIDVDPEGGVHIAWYDRRNDAENRLLDVYYAYSDTCGDGFHPNVRLTETNFDGDLAHHQSGSTFIGDYIGVDTTATSAHIIWADTRHTGEGGREKGSDVYAATLLRDLSARATFDAVFGTTGEA
ncbi:MAG: hypothetical protein KY455_06145 [Euryarchaeota archaeon]|nr:hypothetical protein [Euryarchaeota archaeon]